MASIDYSIYRSFFYHNLYYEVSRWLDLHPELSRDEGIIPSLRELVRDLDPHKWQHSYVNRELANQTLYALKLMKDSIVKLDPSLWEKIQKAIDYYQDLCKEEDEELEKMKSASDTGHDMFPYFDGVDDGVDDSEKKEEQEKDGDDDEEEEVHFVHHHTKPLVLFDETEIIDENECEKDGAEKFEYEELPSRDEDEDDDDDDDDDAEQVDDDEKEDESIIITTTITRKRSRNVDYEKNSDVEKHERPKKRLRCVRMFPRIIKYYF